MFCLTIIATINRPTLTAAVYSALDGGFRMDDFEAVDPQLIEDVRRQYFAVAP